MKDKRGQITIFVIIAILIVTMIMVVFFLRSNTGSEIPIIFQPINNYVDDCLEKVTKEAVEISSLSGGVIYGEKQENLFLNSVSPYYNLQNITKEDIEEDIGQYIDSALLDCFVNRPEEDYYATYENPTTSAILFDNFISITTSFPITIQKQEDSFLIEDFNLKYSTSLYYLYESAKIINNAEVLSNKEFCFSCVDDIANDRNIFISVTNFDEKGILILLNKDLEINNETEVFAFALK